MPTLVTVRGSASRLGRFLARPAAVEHPVLAERALNDEFDCGLGLDEPRGELGSAPAGNDPEQTFGAGEMANRCRDRARIAMERELDATAQAGPVDRGDRGIRQRLDAAEQLVAGPAAVAREIRRGARELVEVGSGREEVRLAGDHERGPVAALELTEHAV